MDPVADIDVSVEDDVRQLAIAVGDGRHRNRAVRKVDLTRDLRQFQAKELVVVDAQLTAQRTLEEVALDVELVRRQREIVRSRCQSVHLERALPRIRTFAHFTRKIADCHAVAIKVDLRRHARDRHGERLELDRTIRQRDAALDERVRRRTRDLELALRRAERPVNLVRDKRQDGEVGLVEADCELDALVVVELFFPIGKERL